MIWLSVLVVCATARRNRYPLRQNTETLLDLGIFPPLQNVDYDAIPVDESKYPWIARVVHSRLSNNPYMCSASCISFNIFITAATCVASLKIEYTTVIYGSHWLHMKAMVIPANLTRQGYDDIGFLIGKKVHQVKWHHVRLYNGPNRTDNRFFWFEQYGDTYSNYKVVGYSAPQLEVDNYYTDKQYHLKELEVVMNYKICPRFLSRQPWTIYRVPCYNTCSDDDSRYIYKDNKIEATGPCEKWHQVAGSAVITKADDILMGVSTWSLGMGKHNLPVGMAVPNSESFYKNYRCALKIRDDEVGLKPGHYQSLCKE